MLRPHFPAHPRARSEFSTVPEFTRVGERSGAHHRGMTDIDIDIRDRVVDRDDDLRDVLELLLDAAIRRQMWLLFIDERGCLTGPLMPMDDLRPDPDELVTTDDLGTVPLAEVLVTRMRMLLELTGSARTVLVWERRGSRRVLARDAAWARAMAEQAVAQGVPLRAQFLLHNKGLRQLHPDDWV